MKTIIILAGIFVCVLAAPQSDKDAQVVRSDLNNLGIDGYDFAYETSNGISAQEQGKLNNAGTDNEAISVSGQFSYKALDGQVYTVTYTADENGFQPQGAHLL